MFDHLIINKNILPLSDEDKSKIPDTIYWQTKDFDCQLTEIYITDDGLVKINRFEHEIVPKNERPHPNEEGILGLAGSIRRINERLETIDYHGYINFYSTVNDEWFEFKAKFTDGTLTNITRNNDIHQ